MSITRINHFDAADGKADELLTFLRDVSAVVARLDGCMSVQLLREVNAPQRLVIVEVWQSIAHHQAAASAIPREEIAKVMPLLASPPRGSYFESPAA